MDNSRATIIGVFDRLEKRIHETSVDSTVIPCRQKLKSKQFDHELKFIEIDELKDGDDCFYINDHKLTKDEYIVVLNYIYEKAPFLYYLPLPESNVKVLGKFLLINGLEGINVIHEARLSTEQTLL